MTLDEYIKASLQKLIDEFKDVSDKHQLSEMEAGEWQGQFISFVEARSKS